VIATPEPALISCNDGHQGERSAAADLLFRPRDLGHALDTVAHQQRLVKTHATAAEHAPRIAHGRQEVARGEMAIADERALHRNWPKQDDIPAFRHFTAVPPDVRILVEHRRHATHGAERDLILLLARAAHPVRDRCSLIQDAASLSRFAMPFVRL
jgi:hypothetical protein